jgi:hypothetical protein
MRRGAPILAGMPNMFRYMGATNTNGRHRLGRNGLEQRRDLINEGPRSSARHRRPKPARVTAEGLSFFAATLAMLAIAVSSWYAFAGASAVAQMLAR